MTHSELAATQIVAAAPRALDRWVTRELRALHESRPGTYARLRGTWRRPERVVVPLAALVCAGLAAVIPDGDAGLFRSAGESMFGPGAFDVFTNGGLQIGPTYLLLLGGAATMLDAIGSPALTRTLLGALQGGLTVWLAMWTVRRTGRLLGRDLLAGRWAVGLVLALGGFAAEAIANGHPEEILLGLLLANAALSASQRKAGNAGALLGLAVSMKVWAAFGVGVLLLSRRWRSVLIGGGTAAALAAVAYGPFLLLGTVNTFHFSWGIARSASLLGHLGAVWGATDWQLRLVQGAAAAAAGLIAAWRRPGSPFGPVMASIAVRLLLDPMRLSYYSGPLITVALIWLWTLAPPRLARIRLAATLAAPSLVLLPYLLSPAITWWAGTGLLLALLGVVLTVERGDALAATAGRTA